MLYEKSVSSAGVVKSDYRMLPLIPTPKLWIGSVKKKAVLISFKARKVDSLRLEDAMNRVCHKSSGMPFTCYRTSTTQSGEREFVENPAPNLYGGRRKELMFFIGCRRDESFKSVCNQFDLSYFVTLVAIALMRRFDK
jgi:hypothetical protein